MEKPTKSMTSVMTNFGCRKACLQSSIILSNTNLGVVMKVFYKVYNQLTLSNGGYTK